MSVMAIFLQLHHDPTMDGLVISREWSRVVQKASEPSARKVIPVDTGPCRNKVCRAENGFPRSTYLAVQWYVAAGATHDRFRMQELCHQVSELSYLHLPCRNVFFNLQEGNRQGRQCWTASPRLYGNPRRRFEIGVAPVTVPTFDAPPPLTAVGANLHFHDRRPPRMSTTTSGFDH